MELRKVQRKLSKNEASLTLMTLPGVQPFSAMTRFVDGGRDRVIELIQLAAQNHDPIAMKWWDVYRELPSYPRSIVSLDDVIASAGITPKALMVVIVSTAMDFGQDIGNLAAAVMHPKVVQRLGESAERIDGPYAEISQRDRMLFLQARGFLPLPKGTTINVHASAQAAAAVANDGSVPTFAADMASLHETRRVVPEIAGAVPAITAGEPDFLQGIAEGELVTVDAPSNSTS